MSGDGRLVRVGVAVCAFMIILGLVTPARASVSDRLDAAERRIARLAAEIDARTDALTAAREEVAAAELRLSSASRRLALLQDVRRLVDAELEAARRHAAELRARLDTVTAEAFMASRGGSVDVATVGAFLDASSLAELGDRLVFTDAATADVATVAAEVAVLEGRLAARRAVLESLVSASGIVVHEAALADAAATEALAREAAAAVALDESRAHAIELVERLRDRLDGVPPLDLSQVSDALHGADAVTYGRWAELFLRVMGAPVCRDNLVAVVAWQVAESTQAAWNPLATTHRMSGSTDFNSVGVQNFASLVQGLRATKETIEFGWEVYGYGAIVGSLRACEAPMTTAAAINASSWCPGCVGGQYVLNVVPRVAEDLDAYLDL
ncbi:MAG TPA: hypothetical protein VF235_03685 [Actinomycetota bacterium]